MIYAILIALTLAQQIEQIICDFFEPVRLTKNYTERKTKALAMVPQIIKWSNHYQIDPILVTVIARDESGFDDRAVGRLGEIGVMQVMPRLFPDFDLTTVHGQIAAGVSHLKAGQVVCGDQLDRILAYYGSGDCNQSNRKWIWRRIARYNKVKK